MFREVSDAFLEMKNELKHLPEEIVVADGVDLLPDEIGISNKTDVQEKSLVFSELEEKTPVKEEFKSDILPTIEKARKFWDDIFSEPVEEYETDKIKNEGLTQEEKYLVKNETGWSDEIVDAIRNMDEYEIYKEAGLVEGEVNGKKCLMRSDIDWNQKDQYGCTNRERVAEGYAPLDKTGKTIQLHHIGQHADSPLAELTFEEHRTGGNDTILHDKSKETEVHGVGNNWDNERKDYWKNRQLDGGETNE